MMTEPASVEGRTSLARDELCHVLESTLCRSTRYQKSGNAIEPIVDEMGGTQVTA